MGIEFKETPQLFGTMHLSALFLIAAACFFFYRFLKDKDEGWLLRFLHYSGFLMFMLEMWKQIFCYYYVFERELNFWFFPWQLCSMAMYCSFFVTYVRGRKQEALLVFLATYSLFAGIVALLTPFDMLRKQIWLFVHGFFYHGLMLVEAMAAIKILRRRKDVRFKDAFFLFLIMAMIAELINVFSHQIFMDIHKEPDMFYITPYYPTTQPVFHELAVNYGILTEIIIYLGVISLGAYGLYRFLFPKAGRDR